MSLLVTFFIWFGKSVTSQRRYDMNGIFQMQGGKKLDFAEIDQCKPVLLGLSLAGNLVEPSMGPNGGSVAMDSVVREECFLLADVDYYLASRRLEEGEGDDSRSYIYNNHLRCHLSSSSLSPGKALSISEY
jgi:hypothetical protein